MNDNIESSPLPKVSILVPAWNGAKRIQRLIESFLTIKYPSVELVMIAGGEDGTYTTAKKHELENIRVVEQEKKNKNVALNKGLANSSGEIIILTDADCIMTNKWLDSLIEPILKEGEHIVAGGNEPLQAQLTNPFVLFQFSYTLASTHIGKYGDYLDGKNVALRRNVLNELGGFDETASTGTDFSLKYELLKREFDIRFNPKSIIFTEYSSAFGKYLVQRSRWLRNFVIYGRKYDNRKDIRVFFEQTSIGVGMLFLPSLTLIFKPLIYPWTFVFLLGLYNRARLIEASKKMKPELNFNSVYPRLPLYLVVEYASGCLALLDYLLPWRRRRW